MNGTAQRASSACFPPSTALSGATANAPLDRQGAVSIIIPVLNESAGIRRLLLQLQMRAPGAEIIVVDGGSADATPELAAPLCDQLVKTSCGRAAQMNMGARVASGGVLWFLHADVEPPADCLETIASALHGEGTVGGFFRIRLPRSRFIYRFTDVFAHYAGKVLRMRCGDHGFFCRRADFEQIGGFPEVPLMEDVEFFRALRRRGAVRVVQSRLIVSPRRYEEVGPIRLTCAFGLIASLYALGASWPLLAKLYRRLCQTEPLNTKCSKT